MKVTLIQATENPIEVISQIASICYDSDPKNSLGLVKHLYRNGHHSKGQSTATFSQRSHASYRKKMRFLL